MDDILVKCKGGYRQSARKRRRSSKDLWFETLSNVFCVATFSQDIADDVEANRLVTDARFIHNIALTRAARKTKNMEEKSISLREPKLDQNDMKEQDIGIIDRCRLFSSLRSWQQFWKANGRFAKQDNSSSIANSAREIHMTGNHPNSIASLEKLHSQREASDKHQTIKAFIRQHWLIIALFILELVFVTKTMSRIMYKNEGTTDSPLPTCFLNKIWPRKRHEEQCADVPTGSDHWTNERKEGRLNRFTMVHTYRFRLGICVQMWFSGHHDLCSYHGGCLGVHGELV